MFFVLSELRSIHSVHRHFIAFENFEPQNRAKGSLGVICKKEGCKKDSKTKIFNPVKVLTQNFFGVNQFRINELHGYRI